MDTVSRGHKKMMNPTVVACPSWVHYIVVSPENIELCTLLEGSWLFLCICVSHPDTHTAEKFLAKYTLTNTRCLLLWKVSFFQIVYC